MQSFIHRYAAKIIGILNGFDRIVFSGSLRLLQRAPGMARFLNDKRVLLKDFGTFAQESSRQLERASCQAAHDQGRELRYLPSLETSKEQSALEIAQRDQVQQGLICILSSVESCMTYGLRKQPSSNKLRLEKQRRKCKHLYHYQLDAQFGWMYVRLQTWLPFNVLIYVNGREWLARQMDRAGIGYQRRDNCFVDIDDLQAAQELMYGLCTSDWPTLLKHWTLAASPAYPQLIERENQQLDYYWSVHASEWATDLMFDSAASLAEIYRPLVRHGMLTFHCPDVMRFFGRVIRPSFKGEIVSDTRERVEGVRLKHCVRDNSVKVYDKQAQVLRVETTINTPREFMSYRAKEGDPQGHPEWLPMRKSVADIGRRAEVSQATNERYLEAMAAADTSIPVATLAAPLCRSRRWKKRPVRALRPWSEPDQPLLRAVLDGSFALNGFRNRDLQQRLYDTPAATPKEKRRRSSQTTRLIRLLRAHRLLRKITRTHRYQLTKKGREILTALVATQDVTLQQINKLAA